MAFLETAITRVKLETFCGGVNPDMEELSLSDVVARAQGSWGECRVSPMSNFVTIELFQSYPALHFRKSILKTSAADALPRVLCRGYYELPRDRVHGPILDLQPAYGRSWGG